MTPCLLLSLSLFPTMMKWRSPIPNPHPNPQLLYLQLVQVRNNKRKVSQSNIDEEILLFKALAIKHDKTDDVEPSSYMVCLQKLNDLGWPKDGPVYHIAMAFLGDKQNREPWLMIPPEFAVETVGDKQGYK